MTGSISELATFVAAENFRYRPDPIAPEQVVLESYTFLPYVRTGVAAVLSTPFDWSLPSRSTAGLSVPVEAANGPVSADVTVTVRGPGDVVGIDAGQVIRCYPRAGAADALVEELAHVEFDRPDFPWLFTPAGPTADHHLVPWVSLVVVARTPGEASPVLPGAHGGLPRLHTTRQELPQLGDAWAWAHAQVMGPRSAAQSIAERLSPANPAINLSRLLCPRKLDPLTSYVACVVPTFQAGVEAGLGLPVTTTTLAPAWSGPADDAEVVLPVYYSFSFSTGQAADFKALAERLHGVRAKGAIGRRLLDTTQPEDGIPEVGTGPGRVMVVEGPLVAPPGGELDPDWPTDAEQVWPAAQVDGLRDRLNAQQAQALGEHPDPHPSVGPPLYAGAHIAHSALDATAPGWFAELNGDPRNRVVAGLGTRVVQNDQEALMAEAWNQVAGVEAANAALRHAQLGRYVGESIHQRHLATLSAPVLLALTRGVHARVRQPTGTTVATAVEASTLPTGITSGAFRRLVRPRGPVARFAAASLADRPQRIAALTADAGDLTKDYVRPYRNPDGIEDISIAARGVIGPELVSHAWGFAGDDRVVLEQRAVALRQPSVTDTLVGGGIDHLKPNAVIRPATGPAEVLSALLLALPAPETIAADREAAQIARTLVPQLRAAISMTDHVVLPSNVSDRVGLAGRVTTRQQRLELVDWTSLVDNVATGTLGGTVVTFSGGTLSAPPASRLDGTEVVFSYPGFDPPIPRSDEIHFIAPHGDPPGPQPHPGPPHPHPRPPGPHPDPPDPPHPHPGPHPGPPVPGPQAPPEPHPRPPEPHPRPRSHTHAHRNRTPARSIPEPATPSPSRAR